MQTGSPHKHPPAPQEGEIYKVIRIHGKAFEIPYGYYEECERNNLHVEPMPIYPDFSEAPCYTAEGMPFVTKMQDACSYYRGKPSDYRECADCEYYMHGDELLGACTCPKNRKSQED